MTFKGASLALVMLASVFGTAAATAGGLQHLSYYIVVNKQGNKVHGSTGTSAFVGAVGSYIATFPVEVTQCVYTATLGRALKSGGGAEDAGYVTTVRSSGFPNGVFVQTFGPRGVLRSRPFHLIVTC